MCKIGFINLKILFFFSFVIFLAGSVFAQREGSVYSKDGSKFENVSFKKNDRLKIISFQYLEKKVYISYDEIAKILNTDKEDITKIVLGKYYKQSNTVSKIKFRKVESDTRWLDDVNKKPWNISLLFQYGYTTPSGKYYEGFSTGKSFTSDIAISLVDEYSLRFSYSTGGINVPQNLIIFESYDPNISIIDQSIEYDTKRYFLSFQMNLPLSMNDKEPSYFYGYGGIGMLTENMTMNLSIEDLNTHIIYSDQSFMNDSYECFRLGMGLVKILTPHLGFNTEISFDVVGAFQEEIEATWFDFKVGFALVM